MRQDVVLRRRDHPKSPEIDFSRIKKLTFRMPCRWSVNLTVSLILGARCAMVIPFAPCGGAIIA